VQRVNRGRYFDFGLFLPVTVAFDRQREIAGNEAAFLRRPSGNSVAMAGAIFTALQRRTSRRKQQMIQPTPETPKAIEANCISFAIRKENAKTGLYNREFFCNIVKTAISTKKQREKKR